mmetsp:Transcript_21598/g.63393  ORF Transcript_21598/g.63393 Transcript_21598/m.63393 type:complete len:321 (-) Transcript_21598:176-1138(-)
MRRRRCRSGLVPSSSSSSSSSSMGRRAAAIGDENVAKGKKLDREVFARRAQVPSRGGGGHPPAFEVRTLPLYGSRKARSVGIAVERERSMVESSSSPVNSWMPFTTPRSISLPCLACTPLHRFSQRLLLLFFLRTTSHNHRSPRGMPKSAHTGRHETFVRIVPQKRHLRVQKIDRYSVYQFGPRSNRIRPVPIFSGVRPKCLGGVVGTFFFVPFLGEGRHVVVVVVVHFGEARRNGGRWRRLPSLIAGASFGIGTDRPDRRGRPSRSYAPICSSERRTNAPSSYFFFEDSSSRSRLKTDACAGGRARARARRRRRRRRLP